MLVSQQLLESTNGHVQAGVVATAVRSAGARLSVRFDQFDVLCLLGLVLLTAGLWMWLGLGVALTIAGGLVLALGVVGAAGGPARETDAAELVDGG